jgi:mannosyltransferase
VNVTNAAPGSSDKPSAIPLARAAAIGTLTLITILAAFFRFHALAVRTFWFDEGVSVGIARLDWYNFGRILWRREANMSLYYLLLRIWLHFGQNEAFVRTLSVLLGLAAIPVIYLLGRRLFGPQAGVIVALLLAVNANHVRYSQEARGYSLMVLLCAASSLFFLKCLELPSRRNRIAYVLLSAAAVYAHFYSGLLIIAQGLSSLFLERESIPREMKKDCRWIALLISPVLVFVATTGAGPLRWIPSPGFKDLWELGLRLSGNDGALLLMAYAIAVTAAIFTGPSVPIKQRVGWENWRYRFLLLWLLFPILSVFALSFARPLFLQRYFILCLPALLLLAAAGLSRIRSQWLLALAVLVVAGLSIQGTEAYYRHDFENAQRDNWRAASQYILANYQPGDALVFHVPMGRMPYEYYHSLQAQASAGPVVLYPSHGPQVVFLDFVEKPSYSQLAQIIPRYRRVWLVLSYAKSPSGPDETSTALTNLIATDHPNVEPHDFTGVGVFLYSGAAK